MKQVFLFFYLLFSSALFAQQFDNSWIIGYCGCGDNPPIFNDEFGVYKVAFSGNDPILTDIGNKAINMSECNASISDSIGNLLFYTNGEKIYSWNHTLMSNGNAIISNGNGYGVPFPQSSLILPKPQDHQVYYQFQVEKGYFSGSVSGSKLFLNIVDMSENNTLGKVIDKKILIINDTIALGDLSAVKHANGRDWWVLCPEQNTNGYYIIYVSENDTLDVKKVNIGENVQDGLGQSLFTPNGELYLRAEHSQVNGPFSLNIYDFDRCTGLLSNHRDTVISITGFGVGLSVSANSHFIYTAREKYIYQFDLRSPDVFSSGKLVATHNDKISGIYPSYWSTAELAPDGRIYMASIAATFNLHVINYPDRSVDSVNFFQDGILLEYYNLTIPHFPHYRLGPIDGSPCDTLGLDNHPLCHWRWEQERLNQPLEVTFTDLTTYEPTYWFWDFGDGSTSTERHPFHTYDSAGVYTVCLVVGNANSSDTLCRVLPLGDVSSSEEVEAQQRRVSVTPNPFTDHLTVFTPDTERDLRFQLFTVLGSVVIDQAISGGVVRIETGELAAGVYFWRVLKGGRVVQSDLIVR